MGKHKWNTIAAALALLLSGGLLLQDGLTELYVRLDAGPLERFARETLADSGEGASTQYGLWPVSVWPNAGVVEFHTRQGPAFGGVEKGFYYSEDDTPVSFQATGYPLAEDGTGWTWTDPYGNHGYTERVRPCWFWYTAVL